MFFNINNILNKEIKKFKILISFIFLCIIKSVRNRN